MAMPALNGSPSSSKTGTATAASSLRPRTRRLISIDDELDASSASDHDRPSPFASRTASPIPSTHPSRANNSIPSSYARSASASARDSSSNGAATLSGIWGNSWSTIQGLASNVLGNPSDSNPQSRRRRPLLATHRRTSSSAPPKQWGPAGSSDSQIGAGSQEERENLVRAMKRRDLLTVNEHLQPDFAGRIKRRSSDERLNTAAASTENEEQDALVYIHHVRPEDTLAGISIKFNCQVPILRKANRMWPNDSIQVKKTIVIPVDACGVKGRPVPAPDQPQENLLLDDFGDGVSTSANQSGNSGSLQNGWPSHSNKTSNPPNPPPSAHSNSEPELPWKHDSWVLLPNDTTPIEIGRMPRRALGYFPSARRKSLAFSDASTPTASLDLSRSSTSTYQSHSQPFPSSQLNPRAGTNATPRPSPQRNRSLSSFSLHGPGGVGTLGKNVRSPGPAQDGLNKLFASHLPNVAPPPDQEYFTPWLPGLLESDGSVQLGNSGARTPSGGGGLDLENVGGAIESWMRKMASRASTILAEQTSTSNTSKRSATPVIGAVGGDLGDLIELRDDAFEIGDGTQNFEPGSTWTANPSVPSKSNLGQFQIPRSDNNSSVRERGRRDESRKRD